MRIKLAPQVRGAVGNSKSNSNRTELMPGERQHQHRDNSYLLLSLCLMFYLFDLKLKPHLSSQVDQAQDERYAICTSSPHLDVLQLTDVPVIGYSRTNFPDMSGRHKHNYQEGIRDGGKLTTPTKMSLRC